MVHRSEYMREYYKANRERILKERSKRYEKDPKWAEDLRTKRREVRKRRRNLKKHQEKEYRKVHGNQPKGRKMKVLHPEENQKSAIVIMYTVPEVAKILKIKDTQIKSWIHHDKIPFPQYRTGNNWRLYTSYEVELLQLIVRRERNILGRQYLQLRMSKEASEEIKTAFKILLGGVPRIEFKEQDNE